MIKLSEIKTNPNNPRLIKDDKFKKLCQSIKDFPKMMALRPIIVDENNVIQGGNMRYKALQHLGFNEVPKEWIKQATDLTDEEKQRFIISDNVGFGEWEWDILANEWDTDKLIEWGLDLPSFDNTDYSEKNKEINTDFDEQKYTFKLEYGEDEYTELKDKIQELGKTPEAIFYEALISV